MCMKHTGSNAVSTGGDQGQESYGHGEWTHGSDHIWWIPTYTRKTYKATVKKVSRKG